MARLRTIRAIALTFVLVSGGGVALTSSGSSSALGNVIQITPTKTTTKPTEVRGSEPVLSNRGEIVAVVTREADLAAQQFEVAFVGAPAEDPPSGKHTSDFAGFDIAVSGDGCVGVVTGVEEVLLVTGLCGDQPSVTTTTLLKTGRLTLSNPALSYDGRFLAVEALDGGERHIARIDTTRGEIELESDPERLRLMPTPEEYPHWFPNAKHGLDISDAGDVIVATFQRIDAPEVDLTSDTTPTTPDTEPTPGLVDFGVSETPTTGSVTTSPPTSCCAVDFGVDTTPPDSTPGNVFVAAWHVVTDADASTDLSTIVSGDAAAAFPSISGDGRFVSYTSLDEPSSDPPEAGQRGPWTYVREIHLPADVEPRVLELGEPVVVSDPDGLAMYTSLSRDGTQLAYATMQHECDESDNGGNVYVLGQLRCRPNRIRVAYGTDPGFTGPFADEVVVETEFGNNAQPALSGNGRWIAWRSTAGDELLGDNDFSRNEHVFMRSRDARLTVDAIDFGEVARESSVIGTSVVRNEGTTTVSIDAVASSATQFVVVTGGTCVVGTTLPPGGSCTIAVQFDSHGLENEITGSLDVREVGHDPLASSAAIRARVTPAPEPEPKLDEPTTSQEPVTPDQPTIPPTDPPLPTEPTAPPTDESAVAALQATPSPLDFGIVPVGITSAAPSVVTVQNTGNAAGTPAVALGGEHAGDFRVVSDTCSATELAPGAVCTVEVVTQPTGGAQRTAALSVRVDADALDIGLLAEAHYMPRLLTAPVTVTEQGITMLVGQGFPPLEDVVIEVAPTGIVVNATADESGRFRIPFSPLGKLSLGSHVLRVTGRPLVYDAVEAPLVVVLSTFEPHGPSGPVFGSSVSVSRSR